MWVFSFYLPISGECKGERVVVKGKGVFIPYGDGSSFKKWCVSVFGVGVCKEGVSKGFL